MANSLERFTPEQLGVLLEEMSKAGSDRPPDDEQATVKRLFENFARPICRSLYLSILNRGHQVCCPDTVMSLFSTGFTYGWKAREMLLETEELEKTLGAAEASAMATTAAPEQVFISRAELVEGVNELRKTEGLPPAE